MKINRKKIKKALVIMMALVMASIPTVASAAEDETMPVHLILAATPIDVTVPTVILMTRTASTGTDVKIATVTNVTNNSGIGVIQVTTAKMNDGFNSWKLADYNETEFETLGMNSMKYGVAISENGGTTKTALSTQASYTFTDFSIDPGETAEVDLYGRASGSTSAIDNVKVGELVLTLGYKMATSQFKISTTSYEYVEGMTWREWVDSDYNTDEYHIITGTDNFSYICPKGSQKTVIVEDGSYDEVDASETIDQETEYLVSGKNIPGYSN